jgi:uncharacterized lipoprotein YajG
MEKVFKMLGVVFVVFLVAMPLTGCDSAPWESGMALSMKVTSPKDDTIVTESTLTVAGRVVGTQSAGAKVTINGADVPIKEGKFSTSVTLTEGANVITVVATSGGATQSKNVTVTYSPAK